MDSRRRRGRGPVGVLFAALMVSLTLAIAYLVVEHAASFVIDRAPAGSDVVGDPLTDAEAAAQVVDSARQIVTAAGLRDVTGSSVFLSCRNENEPPYQAAVYMNFAVRQTNSIGYLSEIAKVMQAGGWTEAQTPAQHFGKKLTRDGVTAVFYRNPDAPASASMRIYGECRTTADHRNDDPAWTEVTDRLR